MRIVGKFIVMSALSVLVACSPSPFDAQMATLRDDPMATAEWPQLESRSTTEQTKGDIMAGQPGLTRCFLVTGGDVEQAMEAIVSTAEEHGWKPDPSLRTDTTRVSHRSDSANDRLSLIVSTDGVGCESLEGGATVLRLTLTYS